MENNKEFAEKNAGKYFRFRRSKVQVVGYHRYNGHSILVSKGAKEYGFGWGAQVLDEEDVLIIRSGDSRYLYVEEYELKRWE